MTGEHNAPGAPTNCVGMWGMGATMEGQGQWFTATIWSSEFRLQPGGCHHEPPAVPVFNTGTLSTDSESSPHTRAGEPDCRYGLA